MIYKAGTVQVTRGSTTVTGSSTEFSKFVSSFSMFRRTGDTSTYIVSRVVSNTQLLLSTPYQGTSYSDTKYSINPDRTTNLGLPLLSPSLPDPSFVVNQALEKIDKNAGTFLDFNSLSEITYSGETGFYIRGDYHSDELKLGRVIKLIDSSGEVTSYDYVDDNSFFSADISITPSGQNVYYSGESGAEEQIVQWDVLSNKNTTGYVFVNTIDTSTNLIVVSGEKIGSAWSADDELRCYGHTMGLGEIDTGLTTTTVPLTAVSGESLDVTEFKTDDLIYNYQRNSSRSIIAGEVASITTATSTDDWVVGDTVYTVKADITVATPNMDTDVDTIEYGAQSQIGTDSVKKDNIDFGTGSDQVWADDIPVSASPLSATNTNDAITEVNTAFINHTTTGEAHLGNDVHFLDDGQGANVLTSIHMQDAVNEIKGLINVSDFVSGSVDSSEDVEQFYSSTFINYPDAFMNSGERWCRMETGTNSGYVRKIDSFDNLSGEFNFASGEGFVYTPLEGDVFSVILTSPLSNHNTLSGLQGGAIDDYYHLTTASVTRLADTSGTNTGDDAGLENVVEDTSPQLGGNLDVNGKNITSTAGLDISIGSSAGNDLTVDTSKLVVEGDTGNVGIGTTSPEEALHLKDGFLQEIKSNPVLAGSLIDHTNMDGAHSVYVSGKYAYVASYQSDSLAIIDISDPTTPVLSGSLIDSTNMDFAYSVYVSGKYAYVAGGNSDSLAIIDISDPTTPVLSGSLIDHTNMDSARSVYVSGKYAYVASYNSDSLAIIDVSDPTTPVLAGSLIDSTNMAGAHSVYVSGKYAYVASYQ